MYSPVQKVAQQSCAQWAVSLLILVSASPGEILPSSWRVGGFDCAHLQETSPVEGLGCTVELHVMNAVINIRSFLEIEPSSRAK